MKSIAWVAAAVAALSLWGAAAHDIMPLADVTPGMTGTGLTVVAGTEPTSFQVEVLGVIREPGVRQSFIVIRASGEAIERSGGIAQGMSGSPIYLEGKLAGALSRAAMWAADPDRPLGLVTPIESMLAVLDELEPPVPERPSGPAIPVELQARGITDVALVNAPPTEPVRDTLYAWPITLPVMAGGFSERAVAILREGMDWREVDSPLLDLVPPFARTSPGLTELGIPRTVSGPASSGLAAGTLTAGGVIGASLVTGDISIGALGTVTLVDESRLLAFGHHFLFSGPTRYFLTNAYVFDTVSALNAPFKFGALGGVIGGVYADRWAAIGGRTDRVPPGIDLSYTISDRSASGSTTTSATLADEPRLGALLYYIGGLESVDRALDRVGAGTATVKYTIDGAHMPSPLVRSNVFLSVQDIAAFVPWETAIVMNILAYNEFEAPELTEVRLTAEITPELKAVGIVDLETDQLVYSAGDTVRFSVQTKDWRGELKEWTGELRIPAWLDTPYLELRAYGGPRMREGGEPPAVIESLEELIAYIEGIPTNDTLTVELFAVDPLGEMAGRADLYGGDGVSIPIPNAVVYGRVEGVLLFAPPSED